MKLLPVSRKVCFVCFVRAVGFVVFGYVIAFVLFFFSLCCETDIKYTRR